MYQNAEKKKTCRKTRILSTIFTFSTILLRRFRKNGVFLKHLPGFGLSRLSVDTFFLGGVLSRGKSAVSRHICRWWQVSSTGRGIYVRTYDTLPVLHIHAPIRLYVIFTMPTPSLFVSAHYCLYSVLLLFFCSIFFAFFFLASPGTTGDHS